MAKIMLNNQRAIRLRSALRQGMLLVTFGVIVGAVFNGLRTDGLPWVGLWSSPSVTVQRLQGLKKISLEEAWALYKSGQALFLDARDPGAFQKGHLPGTINIPPEEADVFCEEVMTFVASGKHIIAYCDGEDYSLSSELAWALQKYGVPQVMVLINGWSLWLEAGFPVERGAE
jgi:3-mercaptopyruvate sulfurtransferase SseA